MKQRKRQSKGKEIRPTFFVFCEGETEEAYIKYLRSCYRLPIEIDAKIAGNRIIASYISNYKKQRTTHPKDETKLKSHIKKYIKGNLNADLKGKLTENKTKATKRAKSLSYGQNPSTLIYRLVEKLDEKNRG